MIELVNATMPYAWGNPGEFSRLFGWPETETPQAELWLGAHPVNPSRTTTGASLADIISADESLAGGDLPFLLKVLAIGAPLSIQSHPSPEQAEQGFAEEEARGIELTSPDRTYKDRYAKPEMLLAATPVTALAGFAEPAFARDRLAGIADDALRADPLYTALRDALAGDDPLRTALHVALADSDAAARFATALTHAAEGKEGTFATAVAHIAAHFPGDPGLAVAALMGVVELAVGDAVFLDAGVMHAYLSGTGVEIQAPSDNVLRGGLTSKKIDIAGLEAITRYQPGAKRIEPIVHSEGPATHFRYWPPTNFALERIDVPAGIHATLPPDGPRIVLLFSGAAEVSSGNDTASLAAGDAVFLGANEPGGTLTATRDAVAYVALATT